MTHPAQPDAESLCLALLDTARREADELLQQARGEAEARLARTHTEQEALRQERLAAARREVARRKERILATLPVETERLRDARREALLQSIFEEARQHLSTRTGIDYPDVLAALASQAIRHMTGSLFVIGLSANDEAAYGTALAAQVRSHLGDGGMEITVCAMAEIHDGGVIVRDGEGRQEWDNRLDSRLQRLWPGLRQQLAANLFTSAERGMAAEQPAGPGGAKGMA